MIRFLSIRHLAVIDALEVTFGPGLNVLTGETGAGKSILVEALGLLIGERASSELVRTGEEAAAVQAIVDTGGTELIVRREVTAEGRSRGFLNGELVTSGALREQCGPLVDLHGQHDHQRLLDPATHLDVLDHHAKLGGRREIVAAIFERWRQVRAALESLQLDEQQRANRLDLLTYQLAEIERAHPQMGEDEALASTRQVLANAERLQRLSGEAYSTLYEGDGAALEGLSRVWRRLEELNALDPRFAPYLESRSAIKAQLEDLAHVLRSYGTHLESSPARLQEVEDRLAVLERLKRKYGPALGDVIERGRGLRAQLDELRTSGERLEALQSVARAARADYVSAAAELSKHRHGAAAHFARALEVAVGELAMPRTRCEVRFAPEVPEASWTARGVDQAELYLSPNPGEDLRPLARVASGGELSRIMLALKLLAPTDAPGKTLVFDEVDAGIGGAVADVVGDRLRQLGSCYQVLCVTHLPQIAAYGQHHFRIVKQVRRERTLTWIEPLVGDEREGELARMIAGARVTTGALATARAMLKATSVASEEKANTQAPRIRAVKEKPRG